jgi:hypothetical protein
MRDAVLWWVGLGGFVLSSAVVAMLIGMMVAGTVRACRSWASAVRHVRAARNRERERVGLSSP